MCTVTWAIHNRTYDLFFNRDEHRSRSIARPPAVAGLEGVSFISPTDTDAGGTWIGVNEYGLTLGLLNFYGAHTSGIDEEREYKSRGMIIPACIPGKSMAEVRARIEGIELPDYRPFVLLLVGPECGVVSFTWDGAGEKLQVCEDQTCPLTSSSYKTEEVSAYRKSVYQDQFKGNLKRPDEGEGNIAPEDLERYHKSHIPEEGPFSVCMHRDDAQSVSLSHVSVGDDHITFRYAPGNPCSGSFSSTLTLERRVK